MRMINCLETPSGEIRVYVHENMNECRQHDISKEFARKAVWKITQASMINLEEPMKFGDEVFTFEEALSFRRELLVWLKRR